MRVECTESTIKLPLATNPEDFLSDLQVIEEVCTRHDPLPDLRFIDRLRPLDRRIRKAVDARSKLESMVADSDHPRLSIGVPEACQDGYSIAHTVVVPENYRSVTEPQVNR
ncbi:hypothetical protein ACQP1G_31420 [Nocardia sp. CA-107356]|uniref:hypothetical protein n=1 Tax=Nocardia sp. CA-107356 TaxID=3239972 RepID=UPI003D925206